MWVLVCPACERVTGPEEWTVTYAEYNTYSFSLDEEGKECDFEMVDTEYCDCESTEHVCGFHTEQWEPHDFAVKIENGEVTKIGAYWLNEIYELERILRINGIRFEKEKYI